MADKLDTFIADIKNAGVDTRSIDFSTIFDLHDDVSNVSSGMLRGFGPRYGMSPLVGQSTAQVIDSDGTYGMLGSVNPTATTQAMYGLFRVYAIYSVPMLDQTDIGTTNFPKQNKTYFWVCVGLQPTAGDASGKTLMAWVPLGTSDSSVVNGFDWVPKAALAYGLLRPLVYTNAALVSAASTKPGNYRLNGYNGAGANTLTQFYNVQNIAQVSGTIDYCSTAILAVSGRTEPAPWIVGAKIANGTLDDSATSCFTGFGPPNFPTDRKFIEGKRTWYLFNVSTDQGLERTYSFAATPTYTDLVPTPDFNTVSANLTGTFVNGGTTQGRLDSGAPTYNDVDFVLWNDQANYLTTDHSLLLSAPGKPLCMVVQGWQRSSYANLEQWVDLRSRRIAPPCRPTVDTDSSGLYTESGVVAATTSATPVNTCWSRWTPYIPYSPGLRKLSDLTAARALAPVAVALGAANSGILRANTAYEFVYAVYDKQLGIESNVGVPAKIHTGTDDFVALCLFADQVTTSIYKQRISFNNVNVFGALGQGYLADGDQFSFSLINYVQFRVYYRPLGAFEWLPALQIDAAQWYFDPNLKEVWACSGAAPGTVGGQPGGFNDYSDLPDDQYNCVVSWKNRVFWLSPKSLVFSNRNNGFQYPVRNAAPIPQGEYKGAIIHNYPGEAEQDSRLIVFGTREIYVGKFSGELSQMSVQVDPDNIGTFFVDGSDFVLNSWTSVTAFSYRSACVADGILFYWGPQGVYRDDGKDTPSKISDALEPKIFDLYAKQRTDDIHCTYSEQTKEIIWYYFQNDVYSTYDTTQEQTKLLIYNTQTKQFYFGGTSACIDASQKIISGTGKMDLVRATGGDRSVIFARTSKASTGVQQAYYFDYRNRGGDMRYGLERMVNQFAFVDATTKRFTLPNGVTGISVGDLLATDQIHAYTNDQDSIGNPIDVEDFVGRVVAIGASTIDVQLPTNITASFFAATLGALNSFPIYIGKSILAANASAGNAFPYQISSQYWCPNGLRYNGFWLYLHLLFKLELLPAEGLDEIFGFTLAHRVPVSLDFNAQEVIFGEVDNGVWSSRLNSDGNQQMYVPLEGVDQMEGQGLKLKLSGFHYAHKWVLQYLMAFANPQVYDFLKRFEEGV